MIAVFIFPRHWIPAPTIMRLWETGAFTKINAHVRRSCAGHVPDNGWITGQRRLDLLQMFCFSAAAISSSRKSGWAMETSSSARYQEERPARFDTP